LNPQVSIITAIAPYHQDISARAIAAASGQTVPVTVLTAYDDHLRGAGYVRNRALERVETPYVTFLDADDTIEPTFCEECLTVVQPDRYVYVDWYEGAVSKVAPDCPYTNGTWHPITTLVPTDWLLRVGGFDETLTGAEDTDLWLKLLSSGCCGIHLKKPLFHYGEQGRRAKAFINSPAYRQTMEHFAQVYGGRQMSCCGDNIPMEQQPPEGLPGDVLVQAIWSGNRQERGPISGRLYERTGNGKLTRIDPRDASAQPHLWRLANPTPQRPPAQFVPLQRAEPAAVAIQPMQRLQSPLANGVGEVAAVLWNTEAPISLEQMIAVKPAPVKPDVGALARLTGKG